MDGWKARSHDDPVRVAGSVGQSTGMPEAARVDHESGADPRGGRDRLFGVIAGVMILAAAILLINSLIGSPQTSDAPPDVQLLAPADGDSLSLPIQIRFRVDQTLSMQPGGWGAGGFHLHVEVAGQELMPGAADIRPASRDEYIWTIATLPSGATTLRLFWADAAHRPVADGASNAAAVVIR